MAETITAGDPMVDFVLPDLNGKPFDSHATRGSGLLMFAFWKQGCDTCRYTMPFLQRFHDLYAADGIFQIRGISQENPEDTREFTLEYSLTFPQALDTDLDITELYHLDSVPGIYLVDSTVRIMRHAPAFVSDEFNEMAKIIAERQGGLYIPIVRPEDDAPAIKPG